MSALPFPTPLFANTTESSIGTRLFCSRLPRVVGNLCAFGFSILCSTLFACSAMGQAAVDPGADVLAERNFPWYDAEQQSPRPFEFGERPGAKSKARAKVPSAPTPKPKPPTAPAAGGGGATGLSVVGNVLVWGVGAILLLVLIGALTWAFLNMETQTAPAEVGTKRSIAESIRQLPFDVESKAGDFRSLTQRLLAADDLRGAAIYLFSHVLVSLDQRDLITLRKGKTNGQYSLELKGFPAIAGYYQRVMYLFEAAFFGDHVPARADVQDCWEALPKFESEVAAARVVDKNTAVNASASEQAGVVDA